MITNSLNHIKDDLPAIYNAIDAKSGTVPAERNLVNLEDAIESIPAAPIENILPLRKDVLLTGTAGDTQMTDLQNALGKTLTLLGEGRVIYCNTTTSSNKISLRGTTPDLHIYEYGASKVNKYLGHGAAGTFTFATKSGNIYLVFSTDPSFIVSPAPQLYSGNGNGVDVKVYKMSNPTT